MLESKFVALDNIIFENFPFPYFSSSKVFKQGFDGQLYSWLEATDQWEFTKTNFYTQHELSLLDITLPINLRWVVKGEMISLLMHQFIETFNVDSLQLVDVTVHKLMDGYRMGVHNDFLGEEETHRLLVQLNSGWSQENGGFLMFFNSKNPEDVSKIIKPLNNTAIGFEISSKSYHAVSTVYNYSRYTLVYTFNKSSNGCKGKIS